MLALGIIFILLILLGVFYLGGALAFVVYLKMYEIDKNAYSIVHDLIEDMKKWIDEGNKLSKYPLERVEKFKDRWRNRYHEI